MSIPLYFDTIRYSKDQPSITEHPSPSKCHNEDQNGVNQSPKHVDKLPEIDYSVEKYEKETLKTLKVPPVVETDQKKASETHSHKSSHHDRSKSKKSDHEESEDRLIKPIMRLKTLKIDDYGHEFDTFDSEKPIFDVDDSDATEESDAESTVDDNTSMIFTVKQLKDIIRLTINEDPISRRVQKCTENDKKFSEFFEIQHEKLNGIRGNCRDTFRWIQKDMTVTNEHLSNAQNNIGKTRDDLNRLIQNHTEKISKLNKHSQEMNEFKNEVLNR